MWYVSVTLDNPNCPHGVDFEHANTLPQMPQHPNTNLCWQETLVFHDFHSAGDLALEVRTYTVDVRVLGGKI